MKISLSDFITITARILGTVFEDGKITKEDLPKIFDLITKEILIKLEK
jgi:hypothetical protein